MLGCSCPTPVSAVSNPSTRGIAPQCHHCTSSAPSILQSALPFPQCPRCSPKSSQYHQCPQCPTAALPVPHRAPSSPPVPHSQDAPLNLVHGLEAAPGLPGGLDELGYLLLHLGIPGQEFVGARGERPQRSVMSIPSLTHPLSELHLLAFLLLLQLLHASSLFWSGQGGSGQGGTPKSRGGPRGRGQHHSGGVSERGRGVAWDGRGAARDRTRDSG